MRKACNEFFGPDWMAYLITGEPGTGKSLRAVQLTALDSITPDEVRWKKAIALCEKRPTNSNLK
ncbi:hypothetical protein ACF2G4_21010 (plasmid) [Pantoea sp. C3]|uniref:hypothetical protein n=1 Tax=Pantoea phytostimulans TaxID=2769024 RepID=UPI0038F65245